MMFSRKIFLQVSAVFFFFFLMCIQVYKSMENGLFISVFSYLYLWNNFQVTLQ